MSDTTRRRRRPAPLDRAKEQKAWYWYDWANTAYVTTIATVLFAPYLISVAETGRLRLASPTTTSTARPTCSVLGLDVSAGSLVFYLVTVATILSALVLPIVGAIADRTPRKTTPARAASPGPARRWRR